MPTKSWRNNWGLTQTWWFLQEPEWEREPVGEEEWEPEVMVDEGSIPDKNALYGNFQKSADWRDRLHRSLAHKSLDIGETEEMNVDNSQRSTGIGWKELAVIAGTLLGGGWMYQNRSQPTASQSATPPVDSEYEVRFYDKDGNPIAVPHITTKQGTQPK